MVSPALGVDRKGTSNRNNTIIIITNIQELFNSTQERRFKKADSKINVDLICVVVG